MQTRHPQLKATNRSEAYCDFVAIETQQCTVVVGALPVVCWLDVWGAGWFFVLWAWLITAAIV